MKNQREPTPPSPIQCAVPPKSLTLLSGAAVSAPQGGGAAALPPQPRAGQRGQLWPDEEGRAPGW